MQQNGPSSSETANIAELVDRISRIVHGLQYVDGLNPAQWEALRFIARANRAPRTPGGLAEYLCTTKGTASQTLIALDSKGYIRRTRCANDRRSVEVDLTDAGAEAIAGDPLTSIGDAIAGLATGEQTALAAALQKMVTALTVGHDLSTFGQCSDCTHYLQGCPDGAEEAEGCRCALTGEFIAPEELVRLCMNHRGTA